MYANFHTFGKSQFFMKTYTLSLFTYLLFFCFSANAQLVFENVPTGENMTILLNLTSTPVVGTTPIDSGDYIGAFYTDGNGDLKCGGFTVWNGNPSQAISFPVYQDDNNTPTVDGFDTGDNFTWKIRTLSNGFTYDATATYSTTPPYTTTFISDGFAQITSFSISTTPVLGCTDPLYLEYDPNANTDDGSCATLIVEGCTDPLYLEFDANANTDDGSCATLIIEGCTDPLYLEYNANANVDDGSCATLIVEGCTDPLYLEYDANANTDDGSCETLIVEGCTDPLYLEYNANANVDDGSCATLIVEGCTDPNYEEYNPAANVDDGSCETLIVFGCMDEYAQNYNPNATADDGSCDYTCDPGYIQVILTYTTGTSIENAGWFINVDGQQIDGETNSEIPADTTVTLHYCIEEGKTVLFSSSGLESYQITKCGSPVPPQQVNPNNTGFVADCTNIGLTENEHNLSIYPNPVIHTLYLDMNTSIDHIKITNAIGQSIKTIDFNPIENSIHLKSLPKGIYYLTVESESQIQTKTFVKQ